MVMFTFKERFVSRIQDGSKRQTIRRLRKRNAHLGDELQFYTGPRMRPRKVGLARCLDCGPITINFVGHPPPVIVDLAQSHVVLQAPAALRDFARLDGFDDWQDMKAFWLETHGDLHTFTGWITLWGDTFKAAPQPQPSGDA